MSFILVQTQNWMPSSTTLKARRSRICVKMDVRVVSIQKVAWDKHGEEAFSFMCLLNASLQL